MIDGLSQTNAKKKNVKDQLSCKILDSEATLTLHFLFMWC